MELETSSVAATPKITLYLLQHSQALRILWLLKVLYLPYTLVVIPRRADRQYPQLKALHPLGKSPILQIGERVITESRLCANSLKALSQSSFEQQIDGHDEYFQEFAGASLVPAVHMCLLFDVLQRAAPRLFRPLIGLLVSPILHALKKELVPYLQVLEAHLSQHQYFGGQSLGLSDILMSWPIDLAVAKGFLKLKDWQGIKTWHTRITSMESYRSAIDESGGYDLASLGS